MYMYIYLYIYIYVYIHMRGCALARSTRAGVSQRWGGRASSYATRAKGRWAERGPGVWADILRYKFVRYSENTLAITDAVADAVADAIVDAIADAIADAVADAVADAMATGKRHLGSGAGGPAERHQDLACLLRPFLSPGRGAACPEADVVRGRLEEGERARAESHRTEKAARRKLRPLCKRMDLGREAHNRQKDL